MFHLKKGDKAPQFEGIDQDGKVRKLADYTGQWVALYFYPRDHTPTCTQQACNLRDNYETLLQRGFAVIGVSADDERSHKKFADKHHLPFPLIADTHHAIADAYGVWGEKKFMGRTFDGIHRTTFIINNKGKIDRIITKPKAKSHAAEILSELN